ncbi:MAG: hypothetical protein JO197_06600 [Acidobacteria bacterium]|nr:hypothetical protein [Acidobacteriota bacterium]MBV9477524.1 hypothetical protein [Acidobacteriota bacterium]
MRKLFLLVLCVAVVCAFAGAAAAQCPSITPVSPGNMQSNVPRGDNGSVTLTWNAVAGANHYEVHFGPMGSGCGASPVGNVTTTHFSPDGPLDDGVMYEWRVQAIGVPTCATPPDSGCSTFTTTSCPTPPNLTAPPDTTIPYGSVTLQWDPSPNATSYEVFVGFDSYSPTTMGYTTATSKTIVVGPGHYIDWYVRARATACDDAESVHAMFNTSCPSTPPQLQSPGDGATLPASNVVNFSWTAVPGASSYDLKMSPDGGTTWNVVLSNIHTTTISESIPAGEYLWEIRANFEGDCDALYADPRTLHVVGASSCDDNHPAELLSPDNGAEHVANPVMFEWSSVPNATSYSLFVQRDNGSPQLLATTTNTHYEATLAATTVHWKVEASFDGCPGETSDIQSFTIGTDTCPANPGIATLVSPANNAGGLSSPVTFRWNPVAGATRYTVYALYPNAQPRELGDTDDTQLSAELTTGTGLWYVQTHFGDDCPTTLSDRRVFTVTTGANCTSAPPQLTAPANGAHLPTPVTFAWSDVPDATSYQLFVAVGDGGFSLYGETSDNSIERTLPTGNIKWFVVAKLAACPELRSAIGFFAVIDEVSCPDGTIALTAPAADATTSSPVHFAWSAVAGATSYRVWASSHDSVPAIVARTSATETTVGLPAGSFTFYVEALRDGCTSILSDERGFTVARAQGCENRPAPTLVFPAGTAQQPTAIHTTPVTLTWNAVPDAIGYRVWVAGDDLAFADVALTRDTHYDFEATRGSFVWFVQALFDGCDPVASARAFFTVDIAEGECPTGVPTITSPAEGATATSPVTFAWTGVDGAKKYRLLVSLNDGEPQLLGTTTDTELTRILPPGSITASVEAVFDECPSTFAARVHFTIPRSQSCSDTGAVLVTPPDGAMGVANPVDFSWQPVSGALRYVVVASLDGGAPTALGTTEDTHFSRKLPVGHIEWFVVALFASCEPVESQHFTFDIADGGACAHRAPILLRPTSENQITAGAVSFLWTPVPDATGYRLWAWKGGSDPAIVASTTEPKATVNLGTGTYATYVEALFDGCPSTESAISEFTVLPAPPCGTPARPTATVIGQALSNTTYTVSWDALPNVTTYEIQEATKPDFSDAATFTTNDVSRRFSHEVTTGVRQYLYRVRGVSTCNDQRGRYSEIVGVFIVASKTNNGSAEVGSTEHVTQTVFLPGSDANPPLHFSVTADKPWITITPSSGLLPPEGITLTISADPTALALGTNTGTIHVQYTGAAATRFASHASTVTTVPISVSLVTPVEPTGQGTPPPDALIFPVVGHAAGVNDSLFESDIRVTNLTAQTMRYAVSYTPTGTNGTQTGSSTEIEILPNATIALDDIISSVFGTGTTSSTLGMLELRPLTTSADAPAPFGAFASTIRQLTTAASSRTYNFTPNGTFGQFIPATLFSDFVGRSTTGPNPILSLQQVAQSSAYRANFGFAEASGQPVDLSVRVYDTANTLLATIPVSLQAGEHRQINGMLAQNGVDNLTDGRVEVEVVGGEGKVTAYVSEIDNKTNDPLLVSPVVKGAVASKRWVVPGMAVINNGVANWVSDLRIFNAGAATDATVTFYPQGDPGAAVQKQIHLEAGEIKVLDNVVGSFFAQPNGLGGAIAIDTPQDSLLTATARTYNQTGNGTYGQYIPGVTPAQSVGMNDRALQLLQLEQSSRFRTNIAVVETSGAPATVEVTAIVPDSLASPVITIPLAANEFRQFSLGDFGFTDAAYNARVTVKVIAGDGRVTAYGSAIDATTQDPTYVPAQ